MKRIIALLLICVSVQSFASPLTIDVDKINSIINNPKTNDITYISQYSHKSEEGVETKSVEYKVPKGEGSISTDRVVVYYSKQSTENGYPTYSITYTNFNCISLASEVVTFLFDDKGILKSQDIHRANLLKEGIYYKKSCL